MYNEMKFLFAIDNTKMVNISERDTGIIHSIYPNIEKSKAEDTYVTDINKYDFVIYKNPNNKTNNSIKTFLNNESYSSNIDTEKNPYIDIIEKLDSLNNKSMKLNYRDFAYLSDLGLYPPNRMIVLRRFPDNTEVPHNLTDNSIKNISPISIIIGWIKPDDDKFFSIEFNENWTQEDKFFWDKFSEIIHTETGMELNKTISAPGWKQGFIYNILKGLGYTGDDFKDTEIPFGDPNTLRESPTRDPDRSGLQSNFSINLDTSYEQKYINGIEPGSAFLDIIHNVLKMGTSDMKYVLGDKAKNLMRNFNSESEDVIDTYWESIKEMALSFKNTITNLIDSNGDSKIGLDDIKNINVDSAVDKLIKFGKDGLSAAIYKHRWPLKSSLAMTTGQNVTPWHLTVGHPLNPTISIGNVLVSDNNTIDFSNELGYNDMPIKINVKFSIKQGRNMGKNEIFAMLNNSYERVYETKQIDNIQPVKNERISNKNVNSLELPKTNRELPIKTMTDSELNKTKTKKYDELLDQLLEGQENSPNPFGG